MIIGGVEHERIPIEQIQVGDYVEFDYNGRRIRRVKEVHNGYKHHYLQLEPLEPVRVLRNHQLDPKKVARAWRAISGLVTSDAPTSLETPAQ